MTQYVARYGM